MIHPLETLELRNQEFFLFNHDGSPIKAEFKQRMLNNLDKVPIGDLDIKMRVNTCKELIALIPDAE